MQLSDDLTGATFAEWSRRGGHSAAATVRSQFYFGELATIMDTELLGIETHGKIATNWQRTFKER